MQGRIITFFDHRHYGFIGDLDSPSEYFFHQDDLVPGSAFPAKGLPVSFEITRWKAKIKAINVCVLSSAREILGGEPMSPEPSPKKEKAAVSVGADSLPGTKKILAGEGGAR